MTEQPPTRDTAGATYEAAGVSIDAGDKAVELMKVWIDKARRPEMLGGIGGFAGLFDATALKSYDADPYHKEWLAAYERVRVYGTTTYNILGQ